LPVRVLIASEATTATATTATATAASSHYSHNISYANTYANNANTISVVNTNSNTLLIPSPKHKQQQQQQQQSSTSTSSSKMRFSRDLPSAMPRPQSQRSSIPRWVVLSGVALIVMAFVLLLQTGDSATNNHKKDSLAEYGNGNNMNDDTRNGNDNNGNGHVIPTVKYELMTNDVDIAAAQTDRQVQSTDQYIVMIDAGQLLFTCTIHSFIRSFHFI
jgi:hypothetical protein